MLLRGRHRLCGGGRAGAAAIYPFALCKAILQGLRNQMRTDQRLTQGVHGLQVEDPDESEARLTKLCEEWSGVTVQEDDAAPAPDGHDRVTGDKASGQGQQREAAKRRPIRDAITGQELDASLCALRG